MCGWLRFRIVSILHAALDDLNGFADDHTAAGQSIGSDSRAHHDQEAMITAYGAAGSFFAAAIAAFEDAVNETGTALEGDYIAMALQLRTTAKAFSQTDQSSAERFRVPGTTEL